jgi:putative heme-binding domain-containing protein
MSVVSNLLAHSSADVRAAAVLAVNSSATNSWDPLLWRIARQTNEEPRIRVEAIAGLARRHPQLDKPALSFLLAQLAPANAYLTRLRAAEVLALTEPPPEVLEKFISVAAAETSISPNLVLTPARRASLAPSTAGALVPYLVESIERGWPMSESQLDWVLKATPESVRAQAAELQRILRDQAAKQQALLAEYKPRLTGGDPTRGRTLFFDKAQCFTCHTVGNQGRPVGPDLTKVGAIRSGWDLLESVLLPSVTFAQGFESFVAEKHDGESITGSLVRETADYIVLRNASGTEMLLRRSDIDTLAKSRLSMMPEGLLQALTREEVADLFAFLQDLK